MQWVGRILVILMVLLLAIPTLGIILIFVPVGLWISAIFAGVPVSLQSLVGMKLRKVNPHNIVEPLISATKAGLDLNIDEMEAHYLAGGNVGRVVSAATPAVVERCLDETGIAFFFAPTFHPSMRHAVQVRRDLGAGDRGHRSTSRREPPF